MRPQMVRYTIIDDTDPRLVYTGSWNLLGAPLNPNSPEYNGTVHATNDATATVAFNFTGLFFYILSLVAECPLEAQRSKYLGQSTLQRYLGIQTQLLRSSQSAQALLPIILINQDTLIQSRIRPLQHLMCDSLTLEV